MRIHPSRRRRSRHRALAAVIEPQDAGLAWGQDVQEIGSREEGGEGEEGEETERRTEEGAEVGERGEDGDEEEEEAVGLVVGGVFEVQVADQVGLF